MKISRADFFCLALLWLGTAGIAASALIPEMKSVRLEWVCEFSAVIMLGVVMKELLLRDNVSHATT
jgi:hypothetical protein